MSATIAAVVVAIVATLAAHFIGDQTWVWSIITGVVAGVVIYVVRVMTARRSTT